jgi:nucleoside phosphorylase
LKAVPATEHSDNVLKLNYFVIYNDGFYRLFLASGRFEPFNSSIMEHNSIVVCFALPEEAVPFQKRSRDIPVFFTGIGKANAEKAAREYLKGRAPALLLTCGFAGGLDPALNVGDVVFETANSDGAKDGAMRAKLIGAGAKPVKIFCADKIASTVAEKKKLREETGADAAEMESGAVQSVCHERGVPCATVRVISDTADEDLPLDFNEFLTPDKKLDMGKLMLSVAKKPWKMGALMDLQRKTRLAAERLGEVLVKLVE